MALSRAAALRLPLPRLLRGPSASLVAAAGAASRRRAAAGPAPALRFLCAVPSPSSSRSGKSAPRARRRDGDDDGDGAAVTKERIVQVELHKEATDAYMSYAMSVLLGRALPDVRDGLKPVHRRILYAMHEMGLASRKPYRKCARVVGEVLGKFHPHGDSAVYETLVRMAQDFSMRYPLVQGHGNFGSIDADPPAAMRYTECRLDPLTEAMFLTDLELNTVDYVPNFDNSQKEPSLLPARVPSLLLNGSSGIAVGMATNIPPHNLGELVDALSAIIQNPDATLQELLEYMPGPDFPTGGILMGNDGILEAYRTGRGRIVMRGKTVMETIDEKTKRTAIIINEVPYQTNKSTLVQRIAELVEDKVLEGISDIRDESDRAGMRVVIEVKRGANPAIVLNNLYRHTALQSSFSCNMVAILDGHPKLMGLKEILQAFLDFRCSVIERRAKFKLSQALERKHIVEGIVIGLDNLDAVIQVIRETSNHTVAKEALAKEYGLSEKQAEALLDITLRKLTSLERKKFIDEANSLSESISKLNELLSSKKLMFQLIEQEAADLKSKFATPRRSFLEDSANGEVDDMDVIPNEEMLLILSEKGYLKRMNPNTFNLQNRGTIGKSVGKMRTNDNMSDFIVCQTHDHILYFSDKGIVYSERAYKIPECTRVAAGTPLVQLLNLSDGERITSIVPVNKFVEDQYLVMLTVNGYIKKVPLNAFASIRSTGIISMRLVPGDELKWVRLCRDDDLVALASQSGMVIVNTCNKLRPHGRTTRGMGAMRLKEDDKMAAMDIIPSTTHTMPGKTVSRVRDLSPPWLLFIAENGYGKRVPLNAFRQSSFNRVGLRGYKLPEDCRLAAVFVVGEPTDDDASEEQVVLVSHGGTVNRIKVKDISIQGRGAKGVILMRLEHAGKIQSASLISATAAEEILED
ncbi:probable DNA gyrase subunit A, chloroplastic/mitochondrial [Triticum dicoccoides]|uniref:probable DNA gyrase subunit A, chloroplastic/mitochondrial n=1 Tax=Triticum dicoccoides TaxID=85692 RepID=UPI00188FC6D6|nr:probable DNA gyrase subunit A, chloroplastic/mitochondrial [Triticum dicoccoides]